MIKVKDKTVFVENLTQKKHNITDVDFSSDQDAWNWAFSQGLWAREQNLKIEKLNREAEWARRRALLSFVGTDKQEQLRVYEEKYKEALAWTSNNSSTTPILISEATQTGETVAALAPVVIIEFEAAKAALAAMYGRIEGIRRNAKASILGIDASTPAAATALEAVRWEF